MNQFCTQCGTKITEGSLFCSECGAALASAFLDTDSPKTDTVEFPEPDSFSFSPPDLDGNKSEEIDFTENLIEGVNENENKVKPKNEIDVIIPPNSEKSIKPPNKLAIAIASVLLSLVVLISVTFGQSLFILQHGINNENVKTMARAVLDAAFENLDELPLETIISNGEIDVKNAKGEKIEIGDDASLQGIIYNTIDDYYIETFDIGENEIRELLEEETFKNFLGSIIDGGIDYIMGSGDDEQAIVSSEKAVRLIRANSDEIERITGYKLVETDYEDIENALKSSGINELKWKSAIGGISGDAGKVRPYFSFYERYSTALWIAVIVITAAVLAVLIIINHKARRKTNALIYFGVPCVISGISVTALGLLISIVFTAIGNALKFNVDALQDAFSQAGAKNTVLFCGLAVFGAGVIFIAASILVSKLLKKSKVAKVTEVAEASE